MDKKQLEGILYAGLGVAVGLIIYQMAKPVITKATSKISKSNSTDDTDDTGNFESFEDDLLI